MGFQEKAKEIKKKVHETSLYIGRIPKKYKIRFKEIAKEEFEEDYGMCIRELIRTWEGIFVDPNHEITLKIDMLANEINQMKKEVVALQEQPNEEKKRLSGKIVNRREK